MIDEIKQQVKEVIRYSQGIENPQIDKLIEDWREAKRDFIEAFGGKLIYTWPQKVTFELSKEEKEKRIDNFVFRVEDQFHKVELANFINVNRHDFYSNRLTNAYKMADGTIIPKGIKIIKAFKFFENNAVKLEKIQNEASMIIQENKISGTLCLSVHPLDFLSSSENCHNWHSCHALDGDYRAGNLAYMVDKSTFMCYIRGDKEEKLPWFPETVLWNSKKWRMLMFMSRRWDMLFAGRQYPFDSGSALDFLRDNVLTTVNMGSWTKFSDSLITQYSNNVGQHFSFPSYIPTGCGLEKLSDVVTSYAEDGAEPIFFNDLLLSSCYTPKYAYKVNPFWGGIDTENKPRVEIGGPVMCCNCGNHPIETGRVMLCPDCDDSYYEDDDDDVVSCACCGRTVYYDEAFYLDRYDEYICHHCYEREVGECEDCGEALYLSDLMEKDGKFFCPTCFDKLQEEDEEEEN